ncbi:MAG: PIN domain-containing protein [Verrucomicrobia bacterium]|nr:PIN domain-containing protein [Verrucomicrobiota bacterium]
MKAIADTGFLVAYVSRRDAHHDWALGLEAQVDTPVLTCEAVLAEAAYLLRDSRAILGLLEDQFVALAFDANDHLAHLVELSERYADRAPDLADLCLIRMSELNPDHAIVTTDREDFRVYRRNKRETIPLICPPEK